MSQSLKIFLIFLTRTKNSRAEASARGAPKPGHISGNISYRFRVKSPLSRADKRSRNDRRVVLGQRVFQEFTGVKWLQVLS